MSEMLYHKKMKDAAVCGIWCFHYLQCCQSQTVGQLEAFQIPFRTDPALYCTIPVEVLLFILGTAASIMQVQSRYILSKEVSNYKSKKQVM